MKKTAAIITLALMLCTLSAESFFLGIEGGVGTNSIISGENYKGYTYSSASGYSISVPVIYEFNEWAGIESGIRLSGKNYNLERYYRGSTIDDLRMNNVFIEVPLLARFRTPAYEGFALYGALGSFIGYWSLGRQKGGVIGLTTTEPVSVDQETDLSHRNRVEAGVELSLGCSLDFSHLRAQFGLRYIRSLTDMNLPQEKGGYPLYNSTFTVGFGLMWRCF